MEMADSTRVGWPWRSTASWRASALMTVASMPMVSDVVRSSPCASPMAPRQMLPPPTTMASSRSSSTRSEVISRAKRSTTPPSIVSSDAEQARASPDILRTIRRRCNTRSVTAASLAGALSVTAASVVTGATVSLPVASAADNDLGEPHDLGAPDEVGDRALLVLGVCLLEQAPLFEPPVHPALDDLGEGRLGLALVPGDLLHGGPLGVDLVLGNVLAPQVRGAREGHVDGNIVRQFLTGASHLHEHGVHA